MSAWTACSTKIKVESGGSRAMLPTSRRDSAASWDSVAGSVSTQVPLSTSACNLDRPGNSRGVTRHGGMPSRNKPDVAGSSLPALVSTSVHQNIWKIIRSISEHRCMFILGYAAHVGEVHIFQQLCFIEQLWAGHNLMEAPWMGRWGERGGGGGTAACL